MRTQLVTAGMLIALACSMVAGERTVPSKNMPGRVQMLRELRAGKAARPLLSRPQPAPGSMAEWRETLPSGSSVASWSGFLSAPLYDVSDFPLAIATGDFDTNGILDIVVANYDSDSVSVLRGLGGGRYGMAINFTVGGSPMAVTTADCNGDGAPDIITANDNGIVSVLLSRGNGQFWAKKDTEVAPDHLLSAITAGNFGRNIDDKIDILVVDCDSHEVLYLQGKGDGTFDMDNAASVPVGEDPVAITIADLYNNKIPDFITADAGGSLSWYEVLPDGTFGDGDSMAVNGTPVSVACADIDRNGVLDFAYADNEGDSMVIVYNFNPDTQMDYPVMYRPTWVVSGDFNKDGKTDIAVANGSSPSGLKSDNTVTIFFNGQFDAPVHYVVGAFPQGMVCVDLNKDNNLDLATVNLGDSNTGIGGDISILLGEGTKSSFQAGNAYLVRDRDTWLSSVALGDLNNDGVKDAVVAAYNQNAIGVFLGKEGGAFQYDAHYAVEEYPMLVKLVDLNNDNNLDAVVVNRVSASVCVLLGNGNGSFEEKISYDCPPDSYPCCADVADYTGDGIPDVIVAYSSKSMAGLFVAKRYSQKLCMGRAS